MIKIIAAIRRKPGMSHQEYCAYIKDVHGGLARAKPSTLRKYVQSHIFDGAYGAPSDKGYTVTFARDSVTELWFDDLPAMGANFADPYTREVIGPDGLNFSDMPCGVAMLTSEQVVEVAQPGKGEIKVLHFLKGREGLSSDEFVAAWTAALRGALPAVAKEVRACVQSSLFPAPPQIREYFRSETGEAYDGVTSLWFDEGDVVPLFRKFQIAFERSGVIDPSRSFFVLAREVEIMNFIK